MIAACWISSNAMAFSGGDGSENNPYVIISAEDLLSIPNESTDYFILDADIISFGGTRKVFCGNFDGNGHTINLEQTFSEGVDCNYYNSDIQYFGLFSECRGAMIKNLTITGILDISTRNYAKGTKSASYDNKWSNIHWYFNFYLTQVFVGSICGYSNSSTFANCKTNINIEFAASYDTRYASMHLGIVTDSWFGGIVGYGYNCEFSECSVNSSMTTDLIPDSYQTTWGPCGIYDYIKDNGCGGIAGFADGCTVSDCYSDIIITDNDRLSLDGGGLVGHSHNSNFYRSYAISSMNFSRSGAMAVKGNAKFHDCIGYSEKTQPINEFSFENCYVTTIDEENGQLNNVDPVMLSMQQWYDENCPSWDFENIWYLPSTPDALPCFRIEPSISWEGFAKYGSTITFKSSNPYNKLEITPENSNDLSVDGSSIIFKRAGKISIVISQGSVTPYKPIKKIFTFDVEKLPLYISAKNIEMEYGNIPDLDNIMIFDGFINEDNENSLKSLPSVYCSVTSKSDVGVYNIALSGGESDNYNLLLQNGKIIVVQRSLQATPRSVSRTYGYPNPTFTVEISGFVEGQDEYMITEYPIVTTQANERSNVGEYNLVCKGGNVHPNYKLVYNNGILTVKKAKLVIKAEDTERNEGEFNPSFTLTFNGFRNDDNEFMLEQLPQVYCEADIDSPAGIYPIILEGGEDKNYEYQLQNGVLKIKEGKSGIDEITINEIDETCIVYTLDGVRIQPSTNLRPGCYIIIKNRALRKIRIS